MIYTHNLATEIIDEFEELLEVNDIMIPDDGRTGEDDEACIYGDTYGDLLSKIEEHIINALEENGVNFVSDIYE